MSLAAGRDAMGGQWRIEATGPWLDLLQSSQGTRARNSVVRWSLIEMGYVWASRFLGRRFTNYVRGAPFYYSMGTAGAIRKFRRLGLLQPILEREMHGWDPWSPAGPPKALIEDYRRSNPQGRGALSRTGNYFTLSKTIRANSKRIVRQFVDDLMDSKLRPLVETGAAEQAALTGHRVRATATANKQRVTITIPFGGPRNPLVGKTVRTLPVAEVGAMAKSLNAIMHKRLERAGVAAIQGPLPAGSGRGTNTSVRA